MGSLEVQVRLFLDFCRMEKGLAQNSVLSYARDLERYMAYSGGAEVSVPESAEQVQGYLDSLYKAGLSGRSVARHLTTIRNFYLHLQREKVMEHNPTELLASPKMGQALPHYLNAADLEKLLAAPAPDTRVSGKCPATVATDVIRMGRSRVRVASRTASIFERPCSWR